MLILKKKYKKIVLWDSLKSAPTASDSLTILWVKKTDSKDDKKLSVINYIENNEKLIRKLFLEWVYEFGNLKIKNKTLIEFFKIDLNLSYWWFTPIALKNNLSDDNVINNVIKIIAFEQIVKNIKYESISINSKSNLLTECVKDFCKRSKIKFYITNFNLFNSCTFSYNQIYTDLFKASIQYAYYVICYLLYFKISKINPINKNVIFFDIFVHLNNDAEKKRRFLSNYWTDLTQKLTKWKINSSWIHLYYRNAKYKNPGYAQKICDIFTKNSKGYQSHTIFESFLDFSVLFNILKSFIRLKKMYTSNISLISKINSKNLKHNFNYFLLFNNVFKSSFTGSDSIKNLFYIHVFNKILKTIPHQKLGFYLNENQPWEYALLNAWKKFNHGTIIAVPHSSVRFWDLRYFFDIKSTSNFKKNYFPMPSYLSVNGNATKSNFLDIGFPKNKIINLESLRFLHLNNNKFSNLRNSRNKSKLNLLVCGDFLESTNERIISILNNAFPYIKSKYNIFLKPHPACPIPEKLLNNEIIVTNDNIQKIIKKMQYIFCSNITTISVESYFYGIPVLQLESGDFNFSPLRGMSGVKNIISSNDLISVLSEKPLSVKKKNLNNFLYINSELPMWKKCFDKFY
jgi:surface carbohydrate biosynthesis protein (TIGR04326 family)